nr:mitogen-activated protein kinase kinase kinase YODA-like [Tanacetum cinerariifolium]
MPAWWGKKSSKCKEKNQDTKKKVNNKKEDDDVVKSNKSSFDDPGTRSSGFSGFDSDRKGHPLPQPVMMSTTSFDVSGSVSSSGGDSSVSSAAADNDLFRGYGDAKFSSQPESLNRSREVGHPLPLPPTSPTSPPTRVCNSPSRPSIVSNVKNLENASCQLSKWKKGRLLGRGTFGHVYLGFNSESGQMCAIKEVKVVGDDQSSKESLKQLNQ